MCRWICAGTVGPQFSPSCIPCILCEHPKPPICIGNNFGSHPTSCSSCGLSILRVFPEFQASSYNCFWAHWGLRWIQKLASGLGMDSTCFWDIPVLGCSMHLRLQKPSHVSWKPACHITGRHVLDPSSDCVSNLEARHKISDDLNWTLESTCCSWAFVPLGSCDKETTEHGISQEDLDRTADMTSGQV